MTSPGSPDDRLALNWRGVLQMVPLSRRTIEKMIARREFPAPRVVAGVNRHLFDAAEIRAWWQRQRGTSEE